MERHKFLIETKIKPSKLPKVKDCRENITKALNKLPGQALKKNIKEQKDHNSYELFSEYGIQLKLVKNQIHLQKYFRLLFVRISV